MTVELKTHRLQQSNPRNEDASIIGHRLENRGEGFYVQAAALEVAMNHLPFITGKENTLKQAPFS